MIQLRANNSDLPSNWITCITIDYNGNKWIATNTTAIVVFNEDGVTNY
jgi:hypothetical protein